MSRRKSGHVLRRIKRNLLCGLARKSPLASKLLRAPIPIRLQTYDCGDSPSRLIVFLPGIGDVLEDYEFYGFIDAVRGRGIAADMIIADMHFGYYVSQTALHRLREDVILPAQRRGYKQIDLVGISLGGFGALFYATHYPTEIAQVFLLAPYLGDLDVVGELSAAGGVKHWRSDDISANDYPRQLWRRLKGYYTHSRAFPDLYLGYGLQDKFATANRLLADLLPSSHVHTIPGKHDWPTWMRLWNSLLTEASENNSS